MHSNILLIFRALSFPLMANILFLSSFIGEAPQFIPDPTMTIGTVTRTSLPSSSGDSVSWDGSFARPLRSLNVLVPFSAPDSHFGAGHRVVTLSCHRGETIFSPAAGTVFASGEVSGTKYFSIRHLGNFRTTFTGATSSLPVGESVYRSQAVGACISERLMWGGKFDKYNYLDPISLISDTRLLLP
ncbi:hypothetical protein BSR29_06125 [Boudabousia liubingyangii]|uniref:Peptidase M23 domain-containing protein n=1 Tax=Boudabousia liubingyangii TaxID=1921764 RepID=A0A1Q5PKM7_9ACTO|nr:hypothetical protein BSR29_06125 [Boudabousia liubingyangii]